MNVHHGEKLRLYFTLKKIDQAEMLRKSTFSKSKMYALFKQNEISRKDRTVLISDFDLEDDFFGKNSMEHVEDWQAKYYDLLTENNRILKELAECRAEQLKIMGENTNFSAADKGVIYKQQLKKTNK